MRGRSRRALKRHINHGCLRSTELLSSQALPSTILVPSSKPSNEALDSRAIFPLPDDIPPWLTALTLSHPKESRKTMFHLKHKSSKNLALTLDLPDSIDTLGLENREDNFHSQHRRNDKRIEILDLLCIKHESVRISQGAVLKIPVCASVTQMKALFNSGSIGVGTD